MNSVDEKRIDKTTFLFEEAVDGTVCGIITGAVSVMLFGGGVVVGVLGAGVIGLVVNPTWALIKRKGKTPTISKQESKTRRASVEACMWGLGGAIVVVFAISSYSSFTYDIGIFAEKSEAMSTNLVLFATALAVSVRALIKD